jgi:hypothetical protein
MYTLRRHYRRLLLPPGWVALGFLLLMGCRLLLIDRARLLPENALQLTMPVLAKIAAAHDDTSVPQYFSNPLTSIKTATRWQDASLIGKPISDSINEATVEALVRAIKADSGHARGVRVHFGQAATYGSLVALLDMMLRLEQHKYWLDIEHRPMTFYVINDRAVRTHRY